MKEALPNRTTLIIGTDANGHVGKHNAEIISNVEDEEYQPFIWVYNPEVENQNGTQMRTSRPEWRRPIRMSWKHQDLHGSAAREINLEWTAF